MYVQGLSHCFMKYIPVVAKPDVGGAELSVWEVALSWWAGVCGCVYSLPPDQQSLQPWVEE